MAIFSTKSFICLLAAALIVLPGCAAKGSSTSGMKTGLHVDAVLEFVVEYPLEWKKDRRLKYGSNEGEVRWDQSAENGTLLQVSSHFREYESDDQELGRVLGESPGLTETLREQVDLPAGKAWHVSGQTAQQQVELYIFLTPGRTYAIALKTLPEDFRNYAELMEEVTLSFQTMIQ